MVASRRVAGRGAVTIFTAVVLLGIVTCLGGCGGSEDRGATEIGGATGQGGLGAGGDSTAGGAGGAGATSGAGGAVGADGQGGAPAAADGGAAGSVATGAGGHVATDGEGGQVMGAGGSAIGGSSAGGSGQGGETGTDAAAADDAPDGGADGDGPADDVPTGAGGDAVVIGVGGSGTGGSGTGGSGTGGSGTGGSGTGGSGTGGSGTGGSGSVTPGTGGAGGGSAGTGGGAGANDAGAAGGTSGMLPATSFAVRFANAVMTRWPDPINIAAGGAWEYNHGIVLRGLEQVYRRTLDPRYLTYIQKYADEFVSASGVVNLPAAHSFDIIQPSVLLPFLFQRTGLARYRVASDQIRARYDTIPRNADRGFWHKQIYPDQMWLDSIYMGQPFLMRYGAVFGTCGTFCSDTVVEQALLIAAHVRDTTTGLLYHAWDDSPAGTKAPWANPTTGRSPEVWGRALGWYAMALVDMLSDLPIEHAGRSDLLSILAGIAAALKVAQDPATGLWFQVVDRGGIRADDWLETSGSGMFVYALKVAVTLGYIDASYLAVANRGWQGLQAKITTDAAGLPSITGAVHGMGVQNDYAGYIDQLPTLADSPHGLCAFLLAASEMEAQ